MIWLFLIAVLFGAVYGLRNFHFAKKHPHLTGVLCGLALYLIILFLDQNGGGSVLFFNFTTLMIPAMISNVIDPTGNLGLDVPFIMGAGLVEFLAAGYFMGNILKPNKIAKNPQSPTS